MKRIKYLFLFAIVLVSFGCSKYEIEPNLKLDKAEPIIRVNSFSYDVDKKYFKEDILNETKKILISSTLLDSVPPFNPKQNKDYFHMDIVVKYWHGGAGGGDILTGLSLGLIPSWGTREGIFKYEFNLYKNGKLIRINKYSVDETSYSHLVLLPFGLIDLAIYGLNYEAFKFYREALKVNIQVYNKYEETNNLP